jgi:AraC-like DNA-binding protein
MAAIMLEPVRTPSQTSPAYVEVAPPPALQQFVERLWVHRIAGPTPPDGRRLLPDGRMTLVWIGGLGVRISGPQTRYTERADLPPMVVLGATFRPGAAPQLLRAPAAEFINHHVALDDIDSRLARRLDERLANSVTAADALAALADELARHLRTSPQPDPVVRDAVTWLDHPTATVSEAAALALVSERELQRRFVDHIGYGPKTLHRVLRFQRFMRQLALPNIDLAAAAALAGYADQPHLSRETRRLAGLTPRQLRSWRH